MLRHPTRRPESDGTKKRVRNFALIKEGAEWKVWRDADNSQDLSAFLEKGSEWKVSADSLEQFAVALVNASEADRERLLADNKKMITTELRDALTRKVGPLQVPGSYDRAVSLLLDMHRGLQAASTPRVPVSKAKDLQRAMLRVLRGGRYQHPFYWAGFSLVGDFR